MDKNTGERGDFLHIGNYYSISPVCQSLYDLILWLNKNDYEIFRNAEDGGWAAVIRNPEYVIRIREGAVSTEQKDLITGELKIIALDKMVGAYIVTNDDRNKHECVPESEPELQKPQAEREFSYRVPEHSARNVWNFGGFSGQEWPDCYSDQGGQVYR